MHRQAGPSPPVTLQLQHRLLGKATGSSPRAAQAQSFCFPQLRRLLSGSAHQHVGPTGQGSLPAPVCVFTPGLVAALADTSQSSWPTRFSAVSTAPHDTKDLRHLYVKYFFQELKSLSFLGDMGVGHRAWLAPALAMVRTFCLRFMHSSVPSQGSPPLGSPCGCHAMALP